MRVFGLAVAMISMAATIADANDKEVHATKAEKSFARKVRSQADKVAGEVGAKTAGDADMKVTEDTETGKRTIHLKFHEKP